MTKPMIPAALDQWLTLQNGQKFYVTVAYLQGAWGAARVPRQNPYKHGPEHAQFNYGYDNERAGEHDNVDLPSLEGLPNET